MILICINANYRAHRDHRRHEPNFPFCGARIESVEIATDGAGGTIGYAVTVSNSHSFDGNMILTVDVLKDGTVTGIAFNYLNETPGMGMRCADSEFINQFIGVKTDRFILNKAGGSTADNEIDSVSGASTSSGAVVDAVNAALDFVLN